MTMVTLPPELRALVTNVVGWIQFWFLPRFLKALLILSIVTVLSRWIESRWERWLRGVLTGGADRTTVQALWRRVRLLTLPNLLTRLFFYALAGWLIAEQFGVPREALLWGLTVIVITVLWTGRHLLTDLAAGYILVTDDVLADGDEVSAPFGEGVVERITWFALYLRAPDGTQIIVPHRAVRGAVLKVRRATAETPRVSPKTR